MQYRDWGERSPRWCGIRSEVVEVCGVSVHCVRADAAAQAPSDAPTHLLLHGLSAAGACSLDLVAPLTAFGPVVAPDMPGNILGDTATPHPRAPRVAPNANFVRAFAEAAGLDRVVVHGWSMGGVIALRFAADSSGRVEGVVLACTPLPLPLSAGERLAWRTLGRAVLACGSAAARGLLRLCAGRLIDAKLASLPQASSGWMDLLGGDPSRISPETMALATDLLADLRADPARLRHAVTAFASVIEEISYRGQDTMDAAGRITAPVLLLWGEEDSLVPRPMIDHMLRQRPGWDLHVLQTAGHGAPLEMPDEYVAALARWPGLTPAARGGRAD